MEEKTSVTIILCTLILSVFSCVTSGCYMSEKTSRKAIEAGLHQQTLPGYSMPSWVKPSVE